MEWGSGLAITQPLGQSTIMPWPLGLACSGAVHAVASCDQAGAPLFRDDDGRPPLPRRRAPGVADQEGGVAWAIQVGRLTRRGVGSP